MSNPNRLYLCWKTDAYEVVCGGKLDTYSDYDSAIGAAITAVESLVARGVEETVAAGSVEVRRVQKLSWRSGNAR